MTWFKVDDGFATSVPVLQIPRRYRAQAVGLWVLAGTWAAKELTDGYVPKYVVTEVAASTQAIANHLVAVGLWDVCPDRDGFLFVGWAKYQFTKEQVLSRRSEEAERKKKAREAKHKRSEQHVSDDVRNMSHADTLRRPSGIRAESALPDQTRPDQTRTHLSLVTYGGDVALVDGPEPPTRCESHLLETKVPRCGLCADARKAHEAWLAAQRNERDRIKAEHWKAIKACPVCDDRGLIEVADGQARCDHQAAAHA